MKAVLQIEEMRVWVETKQGDGKPQHAAREMLAHKSCAGFGNVFFVVAFLGYQYR